MHRSQHIWRFRWGLAICAKSRWQPSRHSLEHCLAVPRPPAKASEAKPGGGGRKRRVRRPSVRALKAVRMMEAAETTTAPEATAAETVTPAKEVG